MKVIIIGAHGEARQLINRISTGWSVSVIDMDQEKLRNFNPNRQIEKYQGDGTSTLVLKKAGIENASAIVTLTNDDEVNIEVLKIAKQNDIFRLSSIVNDQNNLQQYKDLDVEVVDPDILIGRRLEHILEPRRVVSQAFAGGRAEASPFPDIHTQIQYITMSSQGGSNDFGDMSYQANNPKAASSKTRGLIIGGTTPSGVNNIESVQIATTGNSVDFGDMDYLGGDVTQQTSQSNAHGGI